MPSKRELEEIEVDINAPKPLNKKQKRLLKKGKIDAPEPEDILKKNQPKPRSQFAVWIGNLAFETSAEELKKFLLEKTSGSNNPLTLEDITRLKMPPKKGFAYVDLKTEAQVEEVVKLSESRLDQRNLLIKNASSFEGRPAEHAAGQKNPPTRILFVGNLSFDTTDNQLEMHFQHCGEILKIRTATFQDTGKCKGFTFIDFKNEEAATKALSDPACKRMNGRSLRMEYGEDRSKRRPKLESSNANENTPSANDQNDGQYNQTGETRARSNEGRYNENRYEPREPREYKSSYERKPKRDSGKNRPSPGAALSNAQRAKQSILPSAGKKMTFD